MQLRFDGGLYDKGNQDFDEPQPPISRTLAMAEGTGSMVQINEYRVIDQHGSCKFLRTITFNISRSGEQAKFSAYMQTRHMLWVGPSQQMLRGVPISA